MSRGFSPEAFDSRMRTWSPPMLTRAYILIVWLLNAAPSTAAGVVVHVATQCSFFAMKIDLPGRRHPRYMPLATACIRTRHRRDHARSSFKSAPNALRSNWRRPMPDAARLQPSDPLSDVLSTFRLRGNVLANMEARRPGALH